MSANAPEQLERVEGLNPLDQIATELAVDRTDAEYISSLKVKCPVRDKETGEIVEMSFGDFMGTKHGQEHGAETLALAREELADGADLSVAMKRALGSQAVRDRETGELVTVDHQSRQTAVTAPDSKKK